jgi:phenylacetate-CoA ligase
MAIWDPQFETLSRDRLTALQSDRLVEVVARVYDKVPFYRERLKSAGLTPKSIRSVDDLEKIPFTTKDDFREQYPFNLFAVPKREIIRIHCSSGTTGKPIVVGYTRRDIETWSGLVARFLTSAGVTADDTVQIAFGYGLFTGGFGLHYGVERIGAALVPASAGFTERQLNLMADFGVTVLVCTPSYALYLGETAVSMGLANRLQLKRGCFGAEPWTERMRDSIEARLGIIATDNYGLSEVIGPGVAGECPERVGHHISEDHFIAEIIDPKTGKRLPDGEVGELVLTSLTKEALPVLRYRTRDLTVLHHEPCACGRTTVRMERVHGRTDDMLIIRGVNVFPSQIETALLEVEGTEPHYRIIVDRENGMDTLAVEVEVNPALFRDEMKGMVELEKKLSERLTNTLGMRPKLRLVEPRSITRSEGKAKRVLDLRKE